MPMTFSMPMFNDFVPEKIRPWIYLCIAMCFQLSGARYLGPLNEIIGADGLMREDILMCMYCNLAVTTLYIHDAVNPNRNLPLSNRHHQFILHDPAL